MATATFGTLSLPPHDDTMEMSSPANRPLDDDHDIDIDFEDYHDPAHTYPDEQMLEDDHTRPGTATDDIMEDDVAVPSEALPEEETMQDGDAHNENVANEEDDELIDYGDDYEEEHAGDNLLPDVLEELSNNTNVEKPVSTEPAAVVLNVDQEVISEFQQGELQHEHKPLGEDPEGTKDQYDETDDAANGTGGAEPAQPGLDDAAILEDFSAYHANTAVATEGNTPGTPTDTGLHPMTVNYGDLHIPLFKSQTQPDGLLKDDNLASLSLAELIRNCRQRLSIKTGNTISAEQELLLGFDRLGLLLVEDSRAAFENSLNDILEVYLQLNHNDGVEEIPPLSLTLSLQLKFASSFSILKQASITGQGLSSFGFLDFAGNEDGFGTGHYEDAEATEETAEDFHAEDYDDTADDGHHEYEDATKAAQQYDHPEEAPGQFEEEGEDYYDQDDYTQEDPSGATDQQDKPPPGIEAVLSGQQHSTHAAYNAPDNVESVEHTANIADSVTHPDAVQSKDAKDESLSGLTTAPLPGDAAVNNTGEYDDDLIDWDDDSDLTGDYSVPSADEPDEFADFLAEIEETEAGSSAKKVQQLLDGEGVAQQDISVPADEHTVEATDGQHVNAEDYLHESGDHQYEGDDPDQANFGQEPDDHEDWTNHQEEDIDQADTYDEQQEAEYNQYNPDYEPGEDDEQFHTAQDFLNDDGTYYEHGLEHAVPDEEEGLDDTVDTVLHHPVDDANEDNSGYDFDGELDFDEEDEDATETHQGNEVPQPSPSGRLHGKRSFDDQLDTADILDEERESKKARAV